MRILQVNSRERGGGAENVAWSLFQKFRERGHESWLVVGNRMTSDPNILLLRHAQGPWARYWQKGSQRLVSRAFRGAWRLSRLAQDIAEPGRAISRLLGHEDFHHPATGQLLNLVPQRPDILHCHNLHGGFFDLRFLPEFTTKLPVVLTLHDAWMLSGHCSHSFDCDRWKTGCGKCPDLTIYPPLERDGTARNWRLKRDLYARSRVHIVTPSSYLMAMVQESILMSAALSTRIIPHGVDLEIFRPADKLQARQDIGLPNRAFVLLSSSSYVRQNRFKDYETLLSAMNRIVRHPSDRDIILLALGGSGQSESIGKRLEIRFVPYQTDTKTVARYYQAADLLVHAARAETFGLVIVEAMATGTPVIATATGGIPELIRSLDACGEHAAHPAHRATGILVPTGGAEALAATVLRLMKQEKLRDTLGKNASRDAQERFDLKTQVQAYLDLYNQILLNSVDPLSQVE